MFLVSTLSDGSDRILLCEFAEVICKQSELIVWKKSAKCLPQRLKSTTIIMIVLKLKEIALFFIFYTYIWKLNKTWQTFIVKLCHQYQSFSSSMCCVGFLWGKMSTWNNIFFSSFFQDPSLMMTLKNLLTLLLIWMTMLWWLIMVLVVFWSLKPRANYYEILDQEVKAEVSLLFQILILVA